MAPTKSLRRRAKSATSRRIDDGQFKQKVPVVAASLAENDLDEPRPWTPPPDPDDTTTYVAWGREHYGQDWYELRETMLRERNFVHYHARDDLVFLLRQCALRKLERRREKGKLQLDKGKTWAELTAWARWHYGEDWYTLWRDVIRVRQEIEVREDGTLDQGERRKKMQVLSELEARARHLRLVRDQQMLADGSTWSEIMAWPPANRQQTVALEAGLVGMPSPSSSSSSSSSSSNRNNGTYQPTSTNPFHQAREGPQPVYSNDGKPVWTPKGFWDRVEFDAIKEFLLEDEYRRKKILAVEGLRSRRSRSEEEESRERSQQAYDELMRLTMSDINFMKARDRWEACRREMEEARLAHDARQKVWLQGQIDMVPRTHEEMDQRFDRWEIQGLSRDEGNCLARMYGFPERPPIVLLLVYWPPEVQRPPELQLPPQELAERLTAPIQKFHSSEWHNVPPSDESIQRKTWDNVLSRAEKNELARIYGHSDRPASEAGNDEPRTQRQHAASASASASPVGDALHQTLSGRIAKAKATSSTAGQTRHGGRSSTGNAQEKSPARASRRLSGQQPGFGMLLGHSSDEVPPSSTRQTRSGGVSPAQPPPKTGAKPQRAAKRKA